jgi:hypothetical protein
MLKLYRYAYRSAITGEFVTEQFAKAHPASTIRQRIWFWQRGAK